MSVRGILCSKNALSLYNEHYLLSFLKAGQSLGYSIVPYMFAICIWVCFIYPIYGGIITLWNTALTVIRYSCSHLAFGHFVTFHLTCCSSLSRIWYCVTIWRVLYPQDCFACTIYFTVQTDPFQVVLFR